MRNVKGKKVLVTGGFGFIGSNVVMELRRKGARVTVLGKERREDVFASRKGLRFAEVDITSPAFTRFLESNDFDMVVHLAGSSVVWPSIERPEEDMIVNSNATLRMLETLRRKRKKPLFVYGSSIGVYGEHDGLLTEETPALPISPYGINKLTSDLYARLYTRRDYGLRTIRIRYSTTYGPGLRKQFIHAMMRAIHDATVSGKPARIKGTGEQRRDHCYVEDHAAATVHLMERAGFNGEVYNVGSGEEHTIREIAEIIREEMGSDARIMPTGEYVEGDVPRLAYDIAKLRGTGFTPSTGIREGIRRTFAWFKDDLLRKEPFRRISVIIPTYNERGNVRKVVKRIEPYILPYSKEREILFVDDSSPDGTGEEVRKLARKKKHVRLITRTKKDGIGGAHHEGLRQATGDVIIILDADCSQDPATIIDFLYHLRTSADMVIGSRYVRGSRIHGQPLYKRLASTAGNRVARAVMGVPQHDFTHSYRALKREVFEKIDPKLSSTLHPDFALEMSAHANRAGFVIMEVPTTFREREIGVSKLVLKGAGPRFLKKVWELRR